MPMTLLLCVCVSSTSEVRERLNVVRRRCAEIGVLSTKDSVNRPTADHVRAWADSLDALLADRCQSDTPLFITECMTFSSAVSADGGFA